jgi:hypothetical protein
MARALTARRGLQAEFEHPGRALMATAPLDATTVTSFLSPIVSTLYIHSLK